MEDSRTYSDEGAKAVRWAIERLADRFIASDEHQTLIDQASHRQQTRSILTLTADVCYSYQLERPEEWTTMGLGEVLGHILPHKVSAPKEFFAAIGPVLLAFVRWGVAQRLWDDRTMDAELAFIRASCRRWTRTRKIQRPPPHGATADPPANQGPSAKRPRISKATTSIFRLRISLKRMVPEIWRQIDVPDLTLAKLHRVVQDVMGWTNSHLHMFHTKLGRFTDPRFHLTDEEWCADVGDTRRIRLADLLTGPGDSIEYEYDFGDSWHHVIACEEIRLPTPGESGLVKPLFLAGARACPPEDVGGTSGYQEFLSVLADAGHPEHEHLVEWSMRPGDRPFDPDHLDPELINRLLSL
jgi:hypothetical protein